MRAGRSLIPGSLRAAVRGSAPLPGRPDPDAVLDVQIVLRRRPVPGRAPRERFAADPAHLALAAGFASRFGLGVVRTHAARRAVELRGRIADLEAAFGVRLHLFSTPAGVFPAPASDVSLPHELAPLVLGVLGLDRRPIARPYFRLRRPTRGTAAAPPLAGLTPPQVAALYGFPPGDGSGQRIALVELGGGYAEADLRAYFADLGLPLPEIAALGVGGAANRPTGEPKGPDAEVMLDLEVAGALAPGARLLAVFAPNDESGFVQAVGAAIHDTDSPPAALAISWGEDESRWSAAGRESLDDLFQDAAALGITVCAASGDLGSYDGIADGLPHVSYPASSPYVLACGGSSLAVADGALAGETVWNEMLFGGGASGGGYSRIYPVPAFQAGLPPGPPGPVAGRGVPDVCAHADPTLAYAVLVDGTAAVLGGTSAAAPLWAALVARLNQAAGTSAGFLNPRLYALAPGSGALRDVAEGDNGAFQARTGWDPCTGLGSPGSALLEARAVHLNRWVRPSRTRKRDPMTTNAASDPRVHPAIRAALAAGTLAVARHEDLYGRDGIEIPAGRPRLTVLLTPSVIHRAFARRSGIAAAPPPAPPGSGDGTMTPMFNSAEHEYLGDQIRLTFLGQSGQPTTLGSASLVLPLPNGLHLNFGQIVALAGDFFGDIEITVTEIPGRADSPPQTVVTTTVNEISDAADPAAVFQKSFAALASDSQAVTFVPRILAVMSTEESALSGAAYSTSGQQPSAAYATLDLDGRYNVATGGGGTGSDYYPEGSYLLLAEINWDHFGPNAVLCYTTGHALAVQQAIAAAYAGSVAARDQALFLAYAMDAFACHFLTDAFAAGHLRTPRKELYLDGTPASTGSFCALHMHNEDNHFGLLVKNPKGEAWRAFGDTRALDTVNRESRARILKAVQASVDEIWSAFNTRQAPASYAALQELPVLGAFDNHADTANSPALFYYTAHDGSGGYTRDEIPDLTSYDWDYYWTAVTTLSEIKHYDGDGYGGYTPPLNTIHPPAGAPALSSFTIGLSGGSWMQYNQVRYAVSFFDRTAGNESELGPWGPWLHFDHQSAPLLSNIPICAQPIANAVLVRRIYRQFQLVIPGESTSSTPFQLAGELGDNTSLTFTDNQQ